MPRPSLVTLFFPTRWRLRHQVLCLLIGVTSLTMLLLSQISSRHLSTVASESARRWAHGIAQAAANSAAYKLATRDTKGIEVSLRQFASLPGVARIEALDQQGHVLVVLPSGPGRDMPASDRGVADPSALEMAWVPVGLDGRDGSIGVSFSSKAETLNLESLRSDTMVAIGVTGLLSIVGASLLLGRALAPLQRVAGFARTLVSQPGAQLRTRTDSHELRELARALNEASMLLQEQHAAIHIRDQHTQGIVDAVPDAIIGIDANGSILRASPAVASIFGREPQDLIGRPLAELLPGLSGDDAESRTLAGLFMRSSGTHVTRFQIDALRHGGTSFPAEVSLARLPPSPGDGVDAMRYACAVRDVTDQRTLDAQLNLYVRALECSSNGIVIADLSLAGKPTIYANAAFTRITGYDTTEAVGRNLDFLQGEDRNQHETALLDTAMSQGRSLTMIARHYRADGSLFFDEISIAPVLDENGKPQHCVCILDDVTERERARLAIAERNARLNAIFDLSPDGFVVFDREGRLVHSNQAFLAMTGWSETVLIEGLNLAQFDQRLATLCAPDASYPAVRPMVAEENRVDVLQLVKPRQRVLTRLARHNAGGQGESILYFRDVTHETQVDRMKSEFLTTAAHELRTPMVSVFGFTELLLHRPVSEERRRDVLETIHRQSSLLIAMINDLLDLARIESRQGVDLQRENTPLALLVKDTVERMAGAMSGHVLHIELGCGNENAVLWVDPVKTSRALTNVLSNAVKYSSTGSVLDISSEVKGTLLGIAVRDRGMGMSAEQLSRVFERFYRADPSGNIPGTGLGMSLVKEIVEQQDGQVEIQSQTGEGTIVTLWLPLAAAGASVDYAPPRPIKASG